MTEYKSFIKTVGSGEGERCNYPTRLDTYGCGCYHNCSYCYAKSLLEFRKYWNINTPSTADINKIRKAISKLESGTVVRLGGMTDCFQPLEQEKEVTYHTIQALNEQGVHQLIVTKSDLISTPKYLKILNPDLAHIQVSLSTLNEELRQVIEPGASPVENRIQTIERLSSLGYDTSIRLSPLIPSDKYFTSRMAKEINRIKCDKLLVEFLRIKKSMLNAFPGLDESVFTVSSGSYKHLPLEKKREYLSWFYGKEISICEDVPEHYEYFRDNFNPNKENCCNLGGIP